MEDLWEELESTSDPGTILDRVDIKKAGLFARFIRSQIAKERDGAREYIEQQLKVDSGISVAATNSSWIRISALRAMSGTFGWWS
jgi:hypothetical protein